MRHGAQGPGHGAETPPAEKLYRIPSHNANSRANIEKQPNQTE
jgi:hypothetical protein